MDTAIQNRIIELEAQIQLLLKNDNINGCSVHFVYSKESDTENRAYTYILQIRTFNPKTKATFLLGEFKSDSEEQTLVKAYAHLKTCHEIEYSYSIEWMKKTGDVSVVKMSEKSNKQYRTHISYFSSETILKALFKFYDGKEFEDYFIFSIKVNPIS